MCHLHIFVLDSHLATLWKSNCPFRFPLVMFPLGSSYLCFFPFDVSDGRCGIIVSVPDHCLPFYFEKNLQSKEHAKECQNGRLGFRELMNSDVICKTAQAYYWWLVQYSIFKVFDLNYQVPNNQGPIIQSVDSLTSLLRVIVNCFSRFNIQFSEIFCWKNVSSFCTAKATHIFSAKKFSIFAYHSMQSWTNH